MPQTLYEFSGDGPPMHIALANGFPPQVYTPLLEPFTSEYRVMSFPPRPMWTNPPAPTTLATWEVAADDLLAAFDAHNVTDVIALGHSLGGVVTMLAAVKQPERFKGIVLLDPTIFPPHALRTLWLMRTVGLEGRFPLVQRALQRRAHFADEQEAFDYWRPKKLFKTWPDEQLWRYVDGLTQPDGNGGLELAWSPAWEARVYASVYTNSWRKVAQLDNLLPVLTLRGTATNTFLEPAAQTMRQRVPSMTYAELEGQGHLFPMEAPDETRAVIQAWLAGL